MEIKDIFFNACRVNFDFLITEYGYQKVEEIAEGHYFNLSFANETTRIEIYYDGKGQYIGVLLIRLIDGLVPKRFWMEGKNLFEDFSNFFSLLTVLDIRHPEGVEVIDPLGPLYTEQDKEEMAERYRKLGDEVPDMSKYRKIFMITPQETERRLERSAYYLKTYAADILQGDFSLFPELQKILESRRRKHAEERKQDEERRAKAKAEKEANGG